MLLPQKVPTIFVLPGELFNVEKGIAVAELEFPIYFNHFLCRKKTLIIGTLEQRERLKIVLQESVFGPENLNLAVEFPQGEKSPHFPNLKAEMDYFRGDRKLEDLVEFGIFDENSRYALGEVLIERREGVGFFVYEKGEKIAEIPWVLDFHIKYDIGQRLAKPFSPPEFGITCLGPSHGFDPEDNTSGFILWVNRRGIMIDPPVNSTEWLRESNVNPKLISHVILTHCHADHDAGTFQKILEEFQITIHTTPTVMDSFIRKYHALTGLPKKQLYELFQFNPVMIDTPVYIEGAEFYFHYSLHSIPAIGFRMHYRNQSFFYTSDHLNYPEAFDKLFALGVLTPGRYEFLKNFPWHYNIIYHEAGIPPLHTPISYLASLPEDVQKRITAYHIARKDFPKDTKISLAKFGIENTVYPEITESRYKDAIRILDILNHVDLFEGFPLSKARDFLGIVEEKSYRQGEKIISKGEPGDKFYIIASGEVRVEGVGTDFKKTYGKYEYFGEASLITGEARSADVYAETDVEVLIIQKNDFLHFIHGSRLEETLRRLAETRKSNSWDVLSSSPVFAPLTSHQKTQLESILHPKKYAANTILLEEGKVSEKAYIVGEGFVELARNGQSLKQLGRGDFVGDIFSLQRNFPAPFLARTKTDCELFTVNRDDLTHFIQRNPGVYMRLLKVHQDIAP
ncbi:MAG: cAMP/cGMP-dependent 3',5'-cyclic-AMP/GMP phosphodiesterase [Leptospiraceae bacterium]|nr:cAMP/cGMP-dependent 3',5'-cyclic-AMP/GMP phosphodiesterase [Leptospiraceae bacterium]MDW8305570.1 cAMP/cGMP-dependent 3',5'-cyclic-AMP/GMP phosphodiesterase [Leptospiraceae bacterium]